MDNQAMVRHIEMNIGGADYSATFFIEDDVIHTVINGKAYSCMATASTAEATVRAMMIEEALKDSLNSRR